MNRTQPATTSEPRKGVHSFLKGFKAITRNTSTHPFWYVCAAILPLQALVLTPGFAPSDSPVREQAALVFELSRLAFIILTPIVLIDLVLSFTLLVADCWRDWRAPLLRWLAHALRAVRLCTQLCARASIVAVRRDPFWGPRAEFNATAAFLLAFVEGLVAIGRGSVWARVLLAVDGLIIMGLFATPVSWVLGFMACVALICDGLRDVAKM